MEINGVLSEDNKFPEAKSSYIELNANENKTVNFSFDISGDYETLYLMVIHDVGFGGDEIFAEVKINQNNVSRTLYENALVYMVYSVTHNQELVVTNNDTGSFFDFGNAILYMLFIAFIIALVIIYFGFKLLTNVDIGFKLT